MAAPQSGLLARLRRFLADEAHATGLPIAALVALALALHVVVTLVAVNPWHPDEHFQILEFAWARSGLSPLADLPWEFSARIRPTLQPTLALGALRALRAIGVASPFVWVLGLRFVSLALGFATLLLVCARVAPGLDRAGRRALWLTALVLWFLPLFLSRYTSENWSGIALAAALPLIQAAGRPRRDVWAGALLGLAFVLRFQIAFAAGALVLWLLVQGRAGGGGQGAWARAARVTAAAALVVALGTACDAWFYQRWVFTPWEYLRVNLFQGVAATFGTEPWHWYLTRAPLWMAPPLGYVLAALCALGVVARPKSPWVWAFAAFWVGHTLIAHKEVRFLFPMLYLLPVMAAYGVEALDRRLGAAASAARRWARGIGWLMVGQSVVLAALLPTPAIHRGKNFDGHFYRFLWQAADARAGAPLYVLQSGDSPYRVWDLEGHVLHHPGVRAIAYAPGTSLDALVPAGTPPADVLVVTRDANPPPFASTAGAHRWRLVYAAESGYRAMARPLGLEDSALVAWLERVDEWTSSEWVRRVYQLDAPASARPS